MQRRNDELDPHGVIRESFAIEGITKPECRSIFLDWALSLDDGVTTERAVRALLSRHQGAPLGHPMTDVLKEALEAPPARGRRGGRAGRLS